MKVQVNDRQQQVLPTVGRNRLTRLSNAGKRTLFLLGLLLSLAGTACTENEDDVQCGTPEWPCDDDGIVTDDSLEI